MLDELSSRVKMIKVRINELEDSSIEFTQYDNRDKIDQKKKEEEK